MLTFRSAVALLLCVKMLSGLGPSAPDGISRSFCDWGSCPVLDRRGVSLLCYCTDVQSRFLMPSHICRKSAVSHRSSRACVSAGSLCQGKASQTVSPLHIFSGVSSRHMKQSSPRHSLSGGEGRRLQKHPLFLSLSWGSHLRLIYKNKKWKITKSNDVCIV